MTTTMKTMICSAVMGVAAGAAILIASMGSVVAQPMPGGPGMHREGGMRGGGDGGGHMGPGGGRRMQMMLDVANASPEQRSKVQQIMSAAHNDMRQQHQAHRASHQQMAQLLSAPQLDPAAIEAARQRSAAQREAQSKRMTQAMIDASAVLTPEQRQKVAGQMNMQREMSERHSRERDALAPARRQ